ncbi:MAG TPA: hypothetical protein VN442_06020 [Bryobacteraceae bacterium]|nr:hypothetical protein [Bryobacteraceae bacterium]
MHRIEEGAMSVALIHLGNISYRLGRTLQFNAATMTRKGDASGEGVGNRRAACLGKFCSPINAKCRIIEHVCGTESTESGVPVLQLPIGGNS